MLPTYCEYINKYLLQPHRRAKGDVPGEHHFVATYLLPRLHRFPFLPLPHYVNPDGQKFVTGDVVYYGYECHDTRCYDWSHLLSIEVKLENPHDGCIKLTRNQYYCWIKEEDPADEKIKVADKPDLFVGLSQHGIAVTSWERFRAAFISKAYSDELPPIPKTVRNTKAFRMKELECFRYSPKREEWGELERQLLASLESQCRQTINSQVKPLEVRTDLPPATRRYRKKSAKKHPIQTTESKPT